MIGRKMFYYELFFISHDGTERRCGLLTKRLIAKKIAHEFSNKYHKKIFVRRIEINTKDLENELVRYS